MRNALIVNARPARLPAAVRNKVGRLPEAMKAVVAQQLKAPPPPPVCYETALVSLAQVKDAFEIKSYLRAAEGLAFWAKMYNDNRAAFEAQKIKAHSLRQMFLCVKILENPRKEMHKVTGSYNYFRTARELGSYENAADIDAEADKLINPKHGKAIHPSALVSRLASASPSWRSEKAQTLREQRRDKAVELRKASEHYLTQREMVRAAYEKLDVRLDLIRAFTKDEKRGVLNWATLLSETADAIVEACK